MDSAIESSLDAAAVAVLSELGGILQRMLLKAFICVQCHLTLRLTGHECGFTQWQVDPTSTGQ